VKILLSRQFSLEVTAFSGTPSFLSEGWITRANELSTKEGEVDQTADTVDLKQVENIQAEEGAEKERIWRIWRKAYLGG
jgi:hypothetical protein